MKSRSALFAVTVVGGIAAFGLRIFQNLRGFEPDTGLPIPGTPANWLLPVGLLLTAFGLFYVIRCLTETDGKVLPFPAVFAVEESKDMLLAVLGIFLIAAAGLADLYESLGMGRLLVQLQAAADPYAAVMTEVSGFSGKLQGALGVLSLASAGALFLALLTCRKKPEAFDGTLMLFPPVALVIRLVLTYRLDSVNPSLSTYYIELLALIFLVLGFYRLSAFAFGAGKRRILAGYSCAAVVLCCAAMADGGPHLSSLLLYAGGGMTLLGFLWLLLSE